MFFFLLLIWYALIDVSLFFNYTCIRDAFKSTAVWECNCDMYVKTRLNLDQS